MKKSFNLSQEKQEDPFYSLLRFALMNCAKWQAIIYRYIHRFENFSKHRFIQHVVYRTPNDGN
uniref:RE46062p n=1 Tax=Drosophila melanogaster TaxID=7227 RepID=D3DN15_DROME|nr:RE46062p [Drosophila melanogaster]